MENSKPKEVPVHQTFKRLWPIIAPYKIGLIGGGVALVLNSSIDSGLIYMLKPLLDKGFGSADSSFLRMMALLVIVMITLRGVTSYIASYSMAWISGKVVMTMRRKVFKHLMHMPVSYFDVNPTGRLLTRVTHETEILSIVSSGVLIIMVREGGYLLSLLGMMVYTSWQLSIILFVLAPLIGMIISSISRKFREISRGLQNGAGNLTVNTEQMIRGHKVVLSYGGRQAEEERFADISNKMRRGVMRSISIDRITDGLVQLVASFALSSVLLIASFPGVMNDSLTAGSFTVIFSSMMAMMRPLKALTNVNAQFQRGMAACQSLFDFLDLETEKDHGTIEVKRAKGEVEFKNVVFQYQTKDEPALKGISFKIPKGKTVALVGRSGSGKSTIASLLTRFYDIEEGKGEILLDGINVQDYNLENLRSHFSLVSQQVYLFDDTIENNIAYAVKDKFSKEDIEKAAIASHSMEFIEKLDKGMETTIGENGASLSGGQRQRIAIARALLRNSPILILDEATSALDTESERAIQDALEELQKDRTVLVIAHRLSTIERADEIIVIDNGEIIERGTHKELLALNGSYKKLHSLQFPQ